ncbi:hypothetical protein GCM10010129_12740 [Streptomyces fumigatiscleroticus]|nr:hypothetical protein GCM10010129_12740 [Streptomyces fumigatiscleroticus]
MLPADLVGVWRLVSFEELDETGAPGPGPLGARPAGCLVYTGDGHVSVHMTRGPGSGPAACLGYAGTWRLDGSRVVHRVEITQRSDWVGTEQVREATLADGLLTLHARTRIAGVEHRRVLVWRRAGG